MATEMKPKPPLLAVSDADWAEAVQREAVLRPLSTQPRVGLPAALAAASALGLSKPRIYGLLRSFRVNPVTALLLPRKPGQARGARRLDVAAEAQVGTAIEEVYLKRERRTLKVVWRQLKANCRTAGLAPPSMTALRARVSARSLRERVKAREGAAAAGNQFRQVRGSLRTERPLQVVQIDHTKVDLMLVDDVTRACIGRP